MTPWVASGSMETQVAKPEWTLLIHGGAGVMRRAGMTPEMDAAYRAGLKFVIRFPLAYLFLQSPYTTIPSLHTPASCSTYSIETKCLAAFLTATFMRIEG